jgi:integrase
LPKPSCMCVMHTEPCAVRSIGAARLHFHDLRHTGNAFAAASGAGLRDLMARMGHDSERAAMIDQHVQAEHPARPKRGRRRPSGSARPGGLMAR